MDCTTSRLKEIISQKTGGRLPANRQIITWEGVELGMHSPNAQLADLGVGENSTLELAIKPPQVRFAGFFPLFLFFSHSSSRCRFLPFTSYHHRTEPEPDPYAPSLPKPLNTKPFPHRGGGRRLAVLGDVCARVALNRIRICA